MEQQKDMQIVYKDNKKYGKLDYVCSWYKKAIDYMRGTQIRAAFVSTNSIVHGESVAIMWEPLFEMGIEIIFAYQTFKWTNEAPGKATVYCVIIGFSFNNAKRTKWIFTDDTKQKAAYINGYLKDTPNVFIQSRGKSLTEGMPKMTKGSQPTDGGHLILSAEERKELISQYPQSTKWIKQYIGADDFINGNLRYCLWLKDVTPKEYRSVKPIMMRLENVSEMRKTSPTASVRRDAEVPMLFTQIRQPTTRYLVVPEVSSDRRKYIPIGYMEPSVIASNMVYIVSDATLYMFGIIVSSVHMAWMRRVCGRLGTGYRYTPAVYNNFPWMNSTEKQQAAIETLAQGVLDARAKFPKHTLADLYDSLTMPPELRKAHERLDRAVLKLYGFGKDLPESNIVAALMERYQDICDKKTHKSEQKPE